MSKTKNELPIAYHEAGHAIACLYNKFKFSSVSIVEDEKYGSLGHVIIPRYDVAKAFEYSHESRNRAEKYFSILLAGPVAEQKYTRKRNNIGASDDYHVCFIRAANLFGSNKVAGAFLSYIMTETELLFTVEGNEDEFMDTIIWDDVVRLADELLVQKEMTYDQVKKFLKEG